MTKTRSCKLKRFLSAALILVLAGLGTAMFASQTDRGRKWVDKGTGLIDKLDRRARRAAGIPLRGTPDLANLSGRLKSLGVRLGAPVFLRIFKQEHELELWIKRKERFVLFARYPICRFSGKPGPKLKEGDHQAPEGFYTVSSGQLNPNSRWHRSFNLGFPNLHDRQFGRTGKYLMVHGGCGSIGCYAMTNPVIDEIWRLVTAALRHGQGRFHVHAYPFRMTKRNMALNAGNSWYSFWSDLKRGHDLFERDKIPPQINVCNRRYVARASRVGMIGNAPLRKICRKVTVFSPR